MEKDLLRRFLFTEFGVRGEWVKLTDSWQASKQHQHGSPCVEQLLGQALAAVVMLSATIKFKGSLILQAQGNGNIKTLVAQASDAHKIRGLVRSVDNVEEGSLEELFGDGRLVLTIGSDNGQPYQGIVPLEGKNLAAAIQTYFEQSEQLKTRLWLFADENQAAGLLLQELPQQQKDPDDWTRVVMLADTITSQELLELDSESMLYRLFNEEKVTLFSAVPVEFACSCSREKIENTLRTLGREELTQILQERPVIEVNCEFCNGCYQFDSIDVENLLRLDSLINSNTKH